MNETIDVCDGGVSGVRGGGITEFAPGGTPRIVEEPDICSVDDALADAIIATVYRVSPPFPPDRALRVEFSIHPVAVGYREEPWIVWEVTRTADERLSPNLYWPNRFSRHIGDKAFGLLVAHLVGLPVPRTDVLSRNVAPFNFGTDTGTCDQWVRTCPRQFSPGEFPTVHGWSDPFAMMASADPDGTNIASVLIQQGVNSQWSGAGRTTPDLPEIEGVAGDGDAFMLGQREPSVLPTMVVERVRDLLLTARDLFGPVRAEWAMDAQQPWLVQLNMTQHVSNVTINAGNARAWLPYNPTTGLDALRSLIEDAHRDHCGIEVTQPVGLTSHIGDILRDANVPARFIRSVSDGRAIA
ncbi:MAG: hypothetical protein M3Q30_02715 [Actinomycetota bacterium]|nr:hypothetical protein [Actinomycetota bacterium]